MHGLHIIKPPRSGHGCDSNPHHLIGRPVDLGKVIVIDIGNGPVSCDLHHFLRRSEDRVDLFPTETEFEHGQRESATQVKMVAGLVCRFSRCELQIPGARCRKLSVDTKLGGE